MERAIASKQRYKKKKTEILLKAPTEFTVVFMVIFLVAVGIIMISSAAFYYPYGESEMRHYYKQAIFAIVGFAGMYVVSRVNLVIINRFVILGYIAVLGGLIFVLMSPQDTKGAKRWIDLGYIKIQPSEFSKIVLILLVAAILTINKQKLSKWKVLLGVVGVSLLHIGLIVKEDFSSAMTIAVIVGVMLFVSYVKLHRLVIVGLAGTGISYLLVKLVGYRQNRIRVYLDPWKFEDGAGRQIVQSLYAIGSGGIEGKGLGYSMQKGYISESHNDIIFAVICEELGLIGAILIIFLFFLLITRIYQIVISSRSMNHFLVGVGVMTHIATQVFVNIGVAVNLFPTTGIPLPFISYGGSSLLIFLLEIGLVLNIARNNKLQAVPEVGDVD